MVTLILGTRKPNSSSPIQTWSLASYSCSGTPGGTLGREGCPLPRHRDQWLNQPFPRWVPGEALAEVAGWGIFLGLVLVMQLLEPSFPADLALCCLGPGLWNLLSEATFPLGFGAPRKHMPGAGETQVSWAPPAIGSHSLDQHEAP